MVLLARHQIVSTNSSLIRQEGAINSTTTYQLEMDLRADTMCFSHGFVAINNTDQVCLISGFHPNMKPIEDVPIQTAATAYDNKNSTTIILVFGQGLWFGTDMEHLLLSPNQLCAFGKIVDGTPKQYSNGTSLHGINTNNEDNITIPFRMHGCISYVPIREPTTKELNECKWRSRF